MFEPLMETVPRASRRLAGLRRILFLAALGGTLACGSPSTGPSEADPEDEEIPEQEETPPPEVGACGDPGAVLPDSGYVFGWPDPDNCSDASCRIPPTAESTFGSNWVYDPELGILAFDEHAGDTGRPDDQPTAGLTVLWQLEIVDNVCLGVVTGAIMSTTDVRVGTAAELNGKSYELAGANARIDCPIPNTPLTLGGRDILFYYVSPGTASGFLCLAMQEVIVSPIAPPEVGEPFRVFGRFSVNNR
jgi:hypothetical protein